MMPVERPMRNFRFSAAKNAGSDGSAGGGEGGGSASSMYFAMLSGLMKLPAASSAPGSSAISSSSDLLDLVREQARRTRHLRDRHHGRNGQNAGGELARMHVRVEYTHERREVGLQAVAEHGRLHGPCAKFDCRCLHCHFRRRLN